MFACQSRSLPLVSVDSLDTSAAKKNRVCLIVPGLQEPEFSRALTHKSAILKVITRAERVASSIVTAEQAMLGALGHPGIEATAVPAASCNFVDDTGEQLWPISMVDPVHVRAEPDHALVHSAHALNLCAPEAEALLDTLNQHFKEDAIEFVSGNDNRWYIAGVDGSGLRTQPLTRVADRNMTGFIDAGQQPQAWRQLITEVQMILHDHPVNLARAEKNLLPINSVWCWGGQAPPAEVDIGDQRIFADDAFTRGLARLSAFKTFPVSEAAALTGKRAQVVCLRSLETTLMTQTVDMSDESFQRAELPAGLQQDLDCLERLLTLALRGLLMGRVGQIELIPCNGHLYRMRRMDLLRFWSAPWSRRRLALTDSVADPSA